jgi:hypothetical protein
MTVLITMPDLVSVKQSGSGSIVTDYFEPAKADFFVSGSGSILTAINAGEIDAGVSGTGWIMVEGNAGQSFLTISGSGNINTSDLLVERCNANISGSGTMQVNASEIIYARISGSGNLYFHGNPKVEANISGSGKVIPAR